MKPCHPRVAGLFSYISGRINFFLRAMPTLLTLKATLRYTAPPVWRRLVLADSLTFWELHFALQIAFGWENAHLFEFSTGRGSPLDFLTGTPPTQPGEDDFVPEWWRDPREIKIGDLLRAPKDKISYVYDMGDHWEHLLVVEKVQSLAEGQPVPLPNCPDGRRAGPPEDIGGIPGFEMFLETVAEKAAGKRKRMPSHYAGLGKYDPEDAELDLVNADLHQLAAIVADEDAHLAEYLAQQAAAPKRSRPAPTQLTPEMMQEMIGLMMQAGIRGGPPKSPKPPKPPKLLK